MKYRGRIRDRAEQYDRVDDRGVSRVVEEQGLRFEVNLSDYLDTGLFLDHRKTRSIIRHYAKGKRVLNLFAYTGSFTVYARSGGAAVTTTVDMSKTYQEWTRRNLELNGFSVDGEAHRLVHSDCDRGGALFQGAQDRQGVARLSASVRLPGRWHLPVERTPVRRPLRPRHRVVHALVRHDATRTPPPAAPLGRHTRSGGSDPAR